MQFENISCSQCGEDFGPGDHGFSHCSDHDFILRGIEGKELMRISFSGDVAIITYPQSGDRITAVMSDMSGMRNWLERKIGCLYDQTEPTKPMVDGERG